jgi:hypothetical protein
VVRGFDRWHPDGSILCRTVLALSYVTSALTIGTPALYATLPLLAVGFAVCDVVFGATPPIVASAGDKLGAHVVPWLYIPLQIAVTMSGAIVAARADSWLATIIGLALANRHGRRNFRDAGGARDDS